MRALARFLWQRLPAFAARVSPALGVTLGDGGWSAAWPVLGAVGPLVAFAAGAASAALQHGVSITDSLVALLVFAGVSACGAGFGFYTLLGYAGVDFARATLGSSWRYSALAARPFVYLVFATLLVLVPLTLAALRDELWRLLRLRATLARASAQAALQAALVYAWAQAAAFLIRPLWSFYGRSPDTPSIAQLQHRWLALALCAALAAGARVFAEARAVSAGLDGYWFEQPVVPTRRSPWVGVPLQAALTLALIAGLLGSWWEAALAYLGLLLPLALQWRAGRWPPVVWLTAHVPLSLRLLATAASAVAVATYVVEPAANRTSSFTPMIVAIVGTMFVSAVLLPRENP